MTGNCAAFISELEEIQNLAFSKEVFLSHKDSALVRHFGTSFHVENRPDFAVFD